jgi:alkylation response protein AidB-like acyl-CoA dehydrogenase
MAPDVVEEDESAAAFRAELVSWLEGNLDEEVVRAGKGPADEDADLEILRAWNARLYDAGWAAVAWPADYGGRDATLAQQLAYQEEMWRHRAPGPVNVIGVSNIAPAIMAVGTEAQKAAFLRPMLRGDVIWSQGMSEPDAGSDLASLRTAAVQDGDRFVINGQKTWNSLGRHADLCQLYVRTDPSAPKHKGISCLLVDLSLPGVEVRPLRTMAGDLTFAELFFSDVVVPADALLGPLHGGWGVAMTTLSFERAGVARLHMGLSGKLDRLVAQARADRGRDPLADPVLRDRLASVYAQIACMRWLTGRELGTMARGGTPSATFGSTTKLLWGRIEQELASLALDVLGPAALAGEWAWNLASSRQASIAGGTTEINRNIVAEHGLGLPREPKVAR